MEKVGSLLQYTLQRAVEVLADNATAIFFSIAILVLISFVSSLISRNSLKQGTAGRVQPKWEVFQILNYCVLAVFIGSITYVAINYKQSFNNNGSGMKNMFLPLMVLWGTCLAWFFGFFGISFLDSESITSEDTSTDNSISNSNSNSNNATATNPGGDNISNNNNNISNGNNGNNSSNSSQDNVGENQASNLIISSTTTSGIMTANNVGETVSRKTSTIIPFQTIDDPSSSNNNSLEKMRLQPRHDTILCSDRSAFTSISSSSGVLTPASKVGGGCVAIANNDNYSSSSHRNAVDPAIVTSSNSLPVSSVAHTADDDFTLLSDEEVFILLLNGAIKDHQLEKKLDDYERAVKLRRMLYNHLLGNGGKKLDSIPYEGYDYQAVFGVNCEIVVGYIPIPVGLVGPLVLNGESLYIPMATTEGCLVASTNRGCKALTSAGGCQSVILKDGITRAPCLKFPSALRAAALKSWLEIPENYARIEAVFNSTTSYGRLESIDTTIAGRNIYLRFCCMSGDAMGMNMVSKGSLKCCEEISTVFPDMQLVTISGNMCTDKKPSAINWILGRGKSVVVEAVVSEKIVKDILKTTVKDLIETNRQKNHIGSAMAGSIGGFNAHASNIVTAVFIATGQDPAQNVESSNCLTVMEYAEDEKSLYVSVTMPCIEVGTVGGGTHLPAQSACLDICRVSGPTKSPGLPGDNSRKLAQIIGAGVLAGELSLMAALAANHLVRAHMTHNRKSTDTSAIISEPSSKGMGMSRKHSSMPDLSQVATSDVEKDSKDSLKSKLPFDSAT